MTCFNGLTRIFNAERALTPRIGQISYLLAVSPFKTRTRPFDSAANNSRITRPLPRHRARAITALPLPTTTYAHCSRRETMAPTPNLTSGATTSCPGGRATPARCSGCPCSRRRPVTVPCGNQPVRRRRDVSISTQATTTGSTAAARASSSRPSRRRPADSRPTTT